MTIPVYPHCLWAYHGLMAAKDKIAPGLLVAAVVTNYAVHKTGWADTICINGRRALHTDTTPGKVLAVGLWLGFNAWFVPHFVFGVLERSGILNDPEN